MKLLCIGDSLTDGYGAAPCDGWTAVLARQSGISVTNEGLCGDTTAGILYRLQHLDIAAYDAVFVMGGSNDILQDEPLTAITSHMEDIGRFLDKAGQRVYIGIPPLTKRESAFFGWQTAAAVPQHNALLQAYREWLRAWGARQGYGIIDFYAALQAAEQNGTVSLYSDGVHPNAAGYAVMAREAQRVLV
ncbi:GDSL-type esterase/lipase family protein [uncultured Megasphaera sp.]|uniref:GDSL-type esterase/lipase family protein n=1 Tax=uncultured Megasphaera sp. TaxID=165188 RepID=UPI00265B5D20|nr:GDSL-type esterase/lipase family protein [uncultured Megasphaera sp.]